MITQLTKSGDTPTNADGDTVTYRIYGIVAGSIALLTNGTGALSRLDSQTGLYSALKVIPSTDGYAVGNTYLVFVQYTIGTAKADAHTFTVF